MEKEILGSRFTRQMAVPKEQLASSMCEGSVPVFATPMMIALMEETSAQCLESFLQEGQTTVGYGVDIVHLAPALEGETVRADVDVIQAEGRKFTFRVRVSSVSTGEIIGEGTHSRFVIDRARFEQKLLRRAEGQ